MSDRIVIHNSMGAAFIGCVLASALYGVSTIQTFYYYNNYGRDPIHIRALEYPGFHRFHRPKLPDVSNLAPEQQEDLGTLPHWPIRSGRIHLQMKTFGELTALKGLSMTVNILAAVGDLFISICLVYMLYRRRTGYKKSNTIISRLIIFTINTGSLTTLFAIGSLISILVWDDTLIYVTFFFCIGRLYANTFLATLNARSILRSVGQDDDANTIHLSGANTTEEAIGMSKGTRPRNISIQIDTARDILRDDDDSNTMKGKISSS
ncbi:hypothetical protein PTI98_011387 [Pleurotus ostreatus]|nr:hypothetical protein PTI98_011387 [Pleurotus ostreatus]